MNKTRTLIKKIIYTTFGEGVYAKAYAKGKIRDINRGVLDEAEAAFIPHFIHENSTVIDIGANYGHYTITLSRLASKGHVYAFEPIPFTFSVLKKIVAHFKRTNVELINAAVSHTNEFVEMHLPLLDFGAPNTGVAYIDDTATKTHKTQTVKTIPLDHFQFNGSIDFIKIDIEGHEPQAFSGMEALLKKHQPVILIEFSHTCLQRALHDPSTFSTYISTQLGYRFAKVEQSKLKWIGNNPKDGYYFLIPPSKAARYNSLFAS